MKRVVQRKYDKGDCGIACIAMVTGQSYEHVEELFYQHELVNDGEYYTFHKDLIEVLDTLGFSAKRKLFTSWSKVEAPAIVKVNLFVERMDGNEDIFIRLMNDASFRNIASQYLMRAVYNQVKTSVETG